MAASDTSTGDPKPATREIFNARSQRAETATLTVDDNGEIVATFEDGSFLKFAPKDAKHFDELIAAHRADNEGQEVVTPEMEATQAKKKAQAEAIINGTADATAGEEQSNAPDQPPAPAAPATQ